MPESRHRPAARYRGRAAVAAALAVAALLTVSATRTPPADPRAGLPAIVFVTRDPLRGAQAGQVPGLGPHGTFASGRGALMERARDGRVRPLLAAGRMLDVADPAVSDDGARVAFAGRERGGARWRIWVVERAGGEPRCVSCAEPGLDSPGDDADPCWWGDSLVFASTRAGGRALYDRSPITQLYLLPPAGTPQPLTHEANGALDPVRDARTGRLVFTRWWFNPWTSAADSGLTREPVRALTTDSVNVWQVVSAELVRDARGRAALARTRLAAGGALPRRRGMGVQPAPVGARDWLALSARNTGLAPRPGTLSLQRYGAPPSGGRRVAGAAIGDDSGDPYTENSNLAAPAACAGVGLSDGRVLLSLDPSGRGDFGLWLVSADGETRTRLLDYPLTLELDAALVPEPPARRAPPARPAAAAARDSLRTFTYLDTDVFAGAAAPARTNSARLHVYRLVGADSVQRLFDVPVPASGRVELALPADTPLFEQLTDARGRALMTAHGPAQVRGFNSGAAGSAARCVGCHLGHSALPVR
ncbi:MAG: hypothetical protein ABL977_10005 [Candidatus Eisenbacteria bacterium]